MLYRCDNCPHLRANVSDVMKATGLTDWQAQAQARAREAGVLK